MELTRRQELDMMEALVKQANGKFIFKNASAPVVYFKGRGTFDLTHMGPESLEEIAGIRYEDVPSALAPLGGLAKIKDTRRAMRIIDRALSSAKDGDIKHQTDAIAFSLKESGVRVTSLELLKKAIGKGLVRGAEVGNIMHSLEVSPLEYFWDEHYARASKISRNNDDYSMGEDGVERLSNTKKMGSLAVVLAKQSDGSFEQFAIELQRRLAYNNLAISFNGELGDVAKLPHRVEIAFRDGFEIMKRTGDSHHLRNFVESCEYVYSPLMIKPIPNQELGVKMVKDAADGVQPESKGAKVDSSKYLARESVWKWMETAKTLQDIYGVGLKSEIIGEAAKSLFPEGVPELDDINVGEVNFAISKLQSVLMPEIRVASNAIISDVNGFINGMSHREDEVSKYCDEAITVFNHAFREAPIEDKLGLALTLRESFNVKSISMVNMKLMSGESVDSLVDEFSRTLRESAGFGPEMGMASDDTVKNTADMARSSSRRLA